MTRHNWFDIKMKIASTQERRQHNDNTQPFSKTNAAQTRLDFIKYFVIRNIHD